MRRRFLACAAALTLLAASGCGGGGQRERTPLWPEIEPYETGRLRVSELHEIWWERSGAPEGKPVYVLHGGPGARSLPYYRRFFNPAVFQVVQHDQRGTGRSTPFLEIRENTTQDLVEDIERLRAEFGHEKIILFGGSWGSTLGLAYAETHPEHTAALVLRGIFTATGEELVHYYCGGSAYFFPEAFEELRGAMSGQSECVSPDTLYRGVLEGDQALRKRYAIAWVGYEAGIARAEPQPLDLEAAWNDEEGWKPGLLSLTVLENWYMANRCFLEEGQLLRDAGRLEGIPVTLINGRYDMICPPLFAHRVHRAIPGSKLVIAELSGHSMAEPRIEAALLEAMRELE